MLHHRYPCRVTSRNLLWYGDFVFLNIGKFELIKLFFIGVDRGACKCAVKLALVELTAIAH